MTILPKTTTPDNPNVRQYRSLWELGCAFADDCVFCGHFDGHDVYKRAGFDRYVVVYGDDGSAAFEVAWSSAANWLDRNPAMDEWGTMRAVVKGAENISRSLDELTDRLRQIARKHPDDTSFDVVVCDSCSDAAEWIDLLRKETTL